MNAARCGLRVNEQLSVVCGRRVARTTQPTDLGLLTKGAESPNAVVVLCSAGVNRKRMGRELTANAAEKSKRTFAPPKKISAFFCATCAQPPLITTEWYENGYWSTPKRFTLKKSIFYQKKFNRKSINHTHTL